ncbi:MAG: serine hydrolase [Eubacterium sp.]|nr:serine hydrolase [Eubacterium sp.]
MGKAVIYYIILVLLAFGCIAFMYMQNTKFDDPYDKDLINEVKIDSSFPTYGLKGYQSKFAIVDDENVVADVFQNDTYATLLVNKENRNPIVSYNSLRRIYPASTTKVMTGIIVCDALNEGKIGLDQTVTLSHEIEIDEEGALVSDLHEGYTITVRNLLYGLMMRSYNDYAVILAELIAGDESSFCDMMNKKAYEIGATGSHFMNPHGLHDDNHYITAYDMYLILNEASKYEILNEIDSNSSFSYYYNDASGEVWTDDISPTNEFLSGKSKLPSNITIHEWKTGTTEAAGNILTMNVEINSKKYFLFVADSVSPDDLYDKIGILFNLCK